MPRKLAPSSLTLRCDACREYREIVGTFPRTQTAQCTDCNRRAVFVGFWRRKLKKDGMASLMEHRKRLVEQIHLLDYIIKEEG